MADFEFWSSFPDILDQEKQSTAEDRNSKSAPIFPHL